MIYPWHLYLMALLYVIAGIMHFIKPKIYTRIMPRYLPKHLLLVHISGIVEVVVGVGLLYTPTKNLAIYTLIAMLIVFLLVHFYMLSSKKAAAGIPRYILLLRIPLQFALMYWAYYYLQF
ncbi:MULTISPECIES: DoxX family protein [Cellulophaga]|uniref:DoxX family protein n=2 Tax=Cellulophaga TaxID=104264 RepID=F0RA06_CELLC|nr:MULTISPECIES: hypothetical protein [Cellulophaga]ADY28335.1 hypothetical protein Celly_0500 [Cellulophaga lytica DSM 7489]AIM59401.1 membrane protein [Cellulophaga lytica]EWH13581.1 hypothetical protein KLA_08460 [Cellulophaga geojensis KL-A]MDO6853819.1 hypothetical protein [Cellulophaga lytica]TVZ09099.1 putative membrane protein [Cellulophaga sp. RHA_52]